MIEARGRTGRKPHARRRRERRSSRVVLALRRARQALRQAADLAGIADRALVAAAIVFVVSALLVKHTTLASKLVLLPIVLGDLHADDLLHGPLHVPPRAAPARRRSLMELDVRSFTVGPFKENTYVVREAGSRRARC